MTRSSTISKDLLELWNLVLTLFVPSFSPSVRCSNSLEQMQKILIENEASLAVADALGKETYTTVRSPVTDLKAIKNETELEGFRQSHIRDGAALARYFSWLEEQLNNGVEVNESQGSDQLAKFRSYGFDPPFVSFWELIIFKF